MTATAPQPSRFGDVVRCCAGCGATLSPYAPGAAEDARTEERLRDDGWTQTAGGWKCPYNHREDVQPGDWVLTRAKVVELHPNDVDLGLELFSKTDQYRAFVRRDLCDPCERPIPDEPEDGTAVWLESDEHGPMVWQRLTDHWYRPGRTERFTWVELCGMGEPVRIAP